MKQTSVSSITRKLSIKKYISHKAANILRKYWLVLIFLGLWAAFSFGLQHVKPATQMQNTNILPAYMKI